MKAVIDSLKSIDPEKVVYYKALNIYTINNPFLNATEQEFKKYFYFNDHKTIIKTEDY